MDHSTSEPAGIAVATAARRHMAGTRFGKYQIVRHLATGGMAELYLARAQGIEGFEKTVVLKQILPEFSTNDRFVQMFLDEARLAAMLHHPNIVQVFDIAAATGGYFFTMEYIHGHDARQLLRKAIETKQRLPLECAVAIVAGAAAGLHHAHEMRDDKGRWLGIVHRDVSPSNILVTFDGGVKVADFGIAKAATQQSAETRTGTLKGKISYMSPEQCRAETLDRRSDVFALGVVLHELTTGRKLFTGDGDFQVMEKIVHKDAPRPSEIIPGYPLALEQIVMGALKRDRDDRLPTAASLQRALEQFAREEKLAVSSLELAALMRSLFGDETPPPVFELAKGSDSESPTRPTRHTDISLQIADVVEPARTAIGTTERTKPVEAKRRRSVTWWIAGAALAAAAAASAVLLLDEPTTTTNATVEEPVQPAKVEPKAETPSTAPGENLPAEHVGSGSASVQPADEEPAQSTGQRPNTPNEDADQSRTGGKQSAGKQSAGKQSAGKQSAGKQSAGKQAGTEKTTTSPVGPTPAGSGTGGRPVVDTPPKPPVKLDPDQPALPDE